MLLIVLICFATVGADYWEDRKAFLKNDENYGIGAKIELSEFEEKVNTILMKFKLEEYNEGFKKPASYLAAQHFFHSKQSIEKTNVFKIIRMLPKGASLHTHDTAMASNEFLYSLTLRENLYGCYTDKKLKLRFFEKSPDESCDWSLLETMRAKDSGFDGKLKEKLTLVVEDPVKTYPSINEAWGNFTETFIFIAGLLNYKPIFKEYFYHALKELYEDNVKYVELRTVLPCLYENGVELTPYATAKAYNETLQEFMEDYPDFIGAKLIYAPHRRANNVTIKSYIKIARMVKRDFPNLLAGFDLVGQEDLGKPLKNFIPSLKIIAKEMRLFFHAGETDWYGSSTDLNIFDAILLGTIRIGHAFSITKHPALMQAVKAKNIAIEVSPISNQVLMLVQDLRNHPANVLMSHGLPVVICNDDPGMWGAKALSHDWYLAFMGIASRNADLKVLKQLALNALNYSAMEKEEKSKALEKWSKDWNAFLENVLDTFGNVLV